MAANTSPIFAKDVQFAYTQIVNSDSTNKKDIFTSDATNGGIIDGLTAASTDTSARVIDFYLYNGTTYVLLGSVSVPAAQGTGGTVPTDALAYIAPPGSGLLPVAAGWRLSAAMEAAVTSGKQIDVRCHAGNF